MTLSSYSAPRRDLACPLRVEAVRPDGEAPHFLGYASNVSTSGLFVQSMCPRPPGTRLALNIHLPEPWREAVSCIGEVVWSREHGGARGAPPGMGIQFVKIPLPALEALSQLCDPTDR